MFRIIIVSAIFVFFTQTTHAQSFLKNLSRFELNFGGESVSHIRTKYTNGQEIPIDDQEVKVFALSLGTAINFPVYEFSPDFSVGISTGVDGGFVLDKSKFMYDDNGDAMISPNEQHSFPFNIGIINIPLLATLKYGGDATLTSQKMFGAGIGIGYQRSYLNISNLTYDLPVVMGEFSYGNQRVVKLRATFPLKEYNPDDNSTILQYNFSIGIIGLIK